MEDLNETYSHSKVYKRDILEHVGEFHRRPHYIYSNELHNPLLLLSNRLKQRWFENLNKKVRLISACWDIFLTCIIRICDKVECSHFQLSYMGCMTLVVHEDLRWNTKYKKWISAYSKFKLSHHGLDRHHVYVCVKRQHLKTN